MAHEPTSAIPTGGDEPQNLETITPGGELPGANPETSSALDAALLEATDGEGTEGLELDEEAKKAAEGAKVKAAAEEQAKADADRVKADAKAKAAEEAKAKTGTAPVVETKKGRFDDIVLPPYTKAKAAEAFEGVKTRADAKIDAQEKTIAELTAERDSLAEKAKAVGQLTPEVAAELEELRSFRAKLDVEADPKFKEWDTNISQNVESIYSKLKGAGVADEVIAKIKEMGGPEQVEWDALTEKLPPQVKRYIEGKLFETEDLMEQKKRALEKAKAMAAEYVKSKAEASTKELESRRKGVEAKVAELSPNIEWLNEKKAAAGAKPEEIAVVESHNKRAAEIKATMHEAITNDSPEMKGLLVLGIAQLQRVNGEFEAFKATAAAEKAKLEADLKDVTDRLNKVKRASTTRISSSAPPENEPKVAKVNYHEDSSSALDRQLKEAVAAQE